MTPLAIDGGDPAVTCGPFEWPLADDAVRSALDEAYQSGDWGRYHGQRCEQLKQELGSMHAAPHVQLTCSGTIAVELAVRAVGVRPGDEVVLAGYDFPGNFRAIEAVGARPALVDVEAGGWCLDVSLLEQLAQQSQLPRVTAIVVSHLHGQLVPMQRLMQLAAEHEWVVVEDACQTPGAVVDGKPAGSWGDVGVMSFGGSKLLTAGRGGALLTGDAEIAQRIKLHASRSNDAYPMSELQAAVLLPQLELLDQRNKVRAENARRLRRATAGITGLQSPAETRSRDTPAYYKLAWQVDNKRLRSTRKEIVAALQAEMAPIDEGFRGFAKRSGRRCRRLTELTNARLAAEQTLVLHHPALLARPHAADQVAAALGKVLSRISID